MMKVTVQDIDVEADGGDSSRENEVFRSNHDKTPKVRCLLVQVAAQSDDPMLTLYDKPRFSTSHHLATIHPILFPIIFRRWHGCHIKC